MDALGPDADSDALTVEGDEPAEVHRQLADALVEEAICLLLSLVQVSAGGGLCLRSDLARDALERAVHQHDDESMRVGSSNTTVRGGALVSGEIRRSCVTQHFHCSINP